MSRAKPPGERSGNDWHKPVKPADAVNVAFQAPDPPESVTLVSMWYEVWELGGPSGIYHVVADYNLIQRYIEMIQRRIDLLAKLDSEGYVTVGSQGQDVQHPAARILADVESKLIPIEDRLGLNPQSRNTILIGTAQTKSALEKWMEE